MHSFLQNSCDCSGIVFLLLALKIHIKSRWPNLNGQDHPPGRLEPADGQNPVENQGLRKGNITKKITGRFIKAIPNKLPHGENLTGPLGSPNDLGLKIL
jgi:hypothetical protein